MATEVKWIKLDVSIPDNKKVKRIRKMPDGNNIILFWVFLLSRAGEANQKGGLYFTENVPYTEEDLAADFDFSTEFVRFAILTLEKYKMIELYDDIIFIKNWDEYQQMDKLEKIKEQNRIRQARYKQKQQLIATNNVEVTLPVTQGNAADIELELELDIEVDKEKEQKPQKNKYGEFNNVLLTKQELEKLKEKYPNDYLQRVERVSGYVASTGKSYKSHYATIINWAKKDEQDKPQKKVVNSDWEKQMQELME